MRAPATIPTSIAGPLLRWYDRHKRDLPWRRRERDPYAQLVAELMLQQTQAATVVKYYERFLSRFPTVKALAAARIDDVLPLWAGLGYYSRARHLHAAARKILEEYAGRMPGTVAGLITLPGVGPYTAGAIASIAYGLRAPVLDGNVARVLMRLTGLQADTKAPGTRAELWRLAEALLPARRCGDFNQAVMELGATVCTPRTPDCLSCPLKASCRARREGRMESIPPPARRARIVPAAVAVAAVGRGDEMLFTQRPPTGLWAGLWELPGEPLQPGESLRSARLRLRRRLPAGVRLAARPMGTVVRLLTHRTITFHVYPGTANPGARAVIRPAALPGSHKAQSCRWVSPADASSLGLSRACEALLRFCSAEKPHRRANNRSRASDATWEPACSGAFGLRSRQLSLH